MVDAVTMPKKFSSVQEAYDDLFDLTSPEFKEEIYYHEAYQKVDPEKQIKILRNYVAALNSYPFTQSAWAFFKGAVYQGYGWTENKFITDIVSWPVQEPGFSTGVRWGIDLDWKKLSDNTKSARERAMLGYVIWFMLANGEFMRFEDPRVTESWNIHNLVKRYPD